MNMGLKKNVPITKATDASLVIHAGSYTGLAQILSRSHAFLSKCFKNMNELMKHRKRKHIELCKPCLPKGDKCRFEENPDQCWFIHKDFQLVRKKSAPPSSCQPSSAASQPFSAASQPSSAASQPSSAISQPSSAAIQPLQSVSQCNQCHPAQSLTPGVQILQKEASESSPSH